MGRGRGSLLLFFLGRGRLLSWGFQMSDDGLGDGVGLLRLRQDRLEQLLGLRVHGLLDDGVDACSTLVVERHPLAKLVSVDLR